MRNLQFLGTMQKVGESPPPRFSFSITPKINIYLK